MAYVGVAKKFKDKMQEQIYEFYPCRTMEGGLRPQDWFHKKDSVNLPNGSIEKLIGYKLTWEDKPVELKD